MPARGRFFITPHAVQRYKERSGRTDLTYAQALDEMIAIGERAHYVGHANDNCERWRTGKPGRWRLTVAPATGAELPQILSVLPEHDRRC